MPFLREPSDRIYDLLKDDNVEKEKRKAKHDFLVVHQLPQVLVLEGQITTFYRFMWEELRHF
jgi:hypothetical protein